MDQSDADLKSLDLSPAFESRDGGYPALVWEKNVDTSAPVGPAFPEASELSARLSGYIRAAIDAKKTAAGLTTEHSLLSTYTTSDTGTDWIAVTMGRYGYQEGDTYKFLYPDGSGYTDYLAALQADVTRKYAENNGLLHSKKATEWQRLILAVNAIGGDPTSFGTYNGSPVDLINDGTYNHADPGWQGINGIIWGLLALDTKSYPVPAGAVTSREKFIRDILALQLTDGVNGNELGGWSLSGGASDPDISAMAIQALAPYYNGETAYTYTNKAAGKEMTRTVRQAVNAALDKLGAIQRDDGDYASWGTVNAESTAQVLVALCALGIDPAEDSRFIKNGKTLLDGVLKYRLSGGGFSHSFSADPSNPSAAPGQFNSMATDQASYALVAYWRFENGMRALYDMRQDWTDDERSSIDAAVAAIKAVPTPGAANYKEALKSALTSFEAVPEAERRYVPNYNELAAAIERVGGKDALDNDTKYPVSLTITAPPTKTVYNEEETFDPAGMVVTLTYSDGSTEAVSDYTLDPAGALSTAVTQISISSGSFRVSQSVTVNERPPWSGSGTEGAPYLIEDLDGLLALAGWVNVKGKSTAGVHFRMTADIDMAGLSGTWTPIGGRRGFQGVFDGGGHCLRNYRPSGGVGVFGTLSGTVKNFGVASGEVVQQGYSGDQGVIVNALSNGTVRNCWNAADITFLGGYSGAIVGACRTGNDNLIEGCYNLGSISSGNNGPVGGIIGYSGASNPAKNALTIRNCYNAGNITSESSMGGIVGHNSDDLAIENCYDTGKLSSTNTNTGARANIGAILGTAGGMLAVSNCYYLENNIEYTAENCVDITDKGTGRSAAEMKAAAFPGTLGAAYKADRETDPINRGYPVLAWQEFPPEQVILTFQVTPAGAQILVKDAQGQQVSPQADGTYLLTPGETYSYTVSAHGCTPSGGSITATKSQTVTVALQTQGGGTPSEDLLKEHREKALASLEKQYGKYDASDFSAENWAALRSAYEKGKEDIRKAQAADEPYVENNIIAALNAAIAAMQAIETNRTGKVTVAVSMDANTLGLGFLIKPTLVEVDRYEKASVVIADLLQANGYSWTNTGTIANGFYLSGVRPVEQSGVRIANHILEAVDEGNIMYSDRSDKTLGELDYYPQSGWMYSVDGTFPGVGASNWSMTQSEVMRWQFTVYGLGADLNADNGAWGTASIIPSLGDKDRLTWAVAELRDKNDNNDEKLSGNAAYLAAIKVLEDPAADQAAIDAAYSALEGQSGGTGGPTGSDPSAAVTARPTATTNASGEASVALTDRQVSQAVTQAKADKADAIVIEPQVSGEASKVSVELPKSGVGDIVKETDADLTVKTDLGSVTIPADGLVELNKQSGAKVTVSVETKDGGTAITVAVDSKPVGKLGRGIIAGIPAETAADGNVLVIVAADGSETVVRKSVVDGQAVKGLVEGSCTVKVVDNTKDFTDTDKHWAEESISFVSSHELFNGTGNGAFTPNGPMTRGMLATVLHRLEDEAAHGTANAFTDVAEGAWYTGAIAWASEQGIVTGNGSGGFGPETSITREQLALMLYRYGKSRGMDAAATGDLSRFADGETVSAWSSEAMAWAAEKGIITGKSGGMLDPQGSATRAEVATMLQRLVRSMVK